MVFLPFLFVRDEALYPLKLPWDLGSQHSLLWSFLASSPQQQPNPLNLLGTEWTVDD